MKSLAWLICLVAAAGSATAADNYLWLDGLPGESTAARHPRWIEVRQMELAATRDPNSGRTSFSALTLIKPVDQTSPQLLLACATGRTIPSGTLETIRTHGTDQLRLLQWNFTQLRVASLEQRVNHNVNSLEEQVALGFSSVEWTYTEINANGVALRNIIAFWNLATGTGESGELPLDTDGDGLPDAYELLYGLDPRAPDADGDLDGDGMTNLMEFRAGTLPNSKDSVFRAHGSFVRPGVVSLQWTRQPGKIYRLLGAATLDGPFEFLRLIEASETVGEGLLELSSTEEHRYFLIETE